MQNSPVRAIVWLYKPKL